MRIYRRFGRLPTPARGASVAIGNFDGIHLGHRAVVEQAAATARDLGTSLGVVTFEPHPRTVLRPQDPPARLTSLRTKALILRQLGVDHLYVLPFDRHLMELSAEDFIKTTLAGDLAVQAIAAGQSFRFGHRRAGDMALLESQAPALGFVVTPVPAVAVVGETCSSSRIRAHLMEGRVLAANRLLGRPYSVEGIVCPGDRRGRELGFPTANLRPLRSDMLLPASGIYVVRAGLRDRRGTEWHDAVASLGTNPTFDGRELRLEVHFLNGEHALYGRRLEILFVERLRGEERYPSKDALIAQMHKDCSDARAIHASPPDLSPDIIGAAATVPP